jgi:hypothetical protein
MKRSSWRIHLLFVLAVLAGQCMAVVHATQHELASGHADTCQTCSIAHAGAGTPVLAATIILDAPAAEPPAVLAPGEFAGCPLSRPRSRAPPFIFA